MRLDKLVRSIVLSGYIALAAGCVELPTVNIVSWAPGNYEDVVPYRKSFRSDGTTRVEVDAETGKKIEFSVGDKDFEVDEYGIFRTPGIELRIKKLQIDYDGTHYDVRVIDVKGDRTHYKSLDAEQYATVSPQ